jgi:hypothetical protein
MTTIEYLIRLTRLIDLHVLDLIEHHLALSEDFLLLLVQGEVCIFFAPLFNEPKQLGILVHILYGCLTFL